MEKIREVKIKSQFYQKVTFPEDFRESFEVFNEMIRLDKAIKDLVGKSYLYKGLFSPAVKYLIMEYINKNKEGFAAYKKAKGEKKDA